MRTRPLAAAVCIALWLLPAAARPAEEKRTPGPLVVYGDDFMFVVKEPKGWLGDVENAPKISAGVVLYREKETFERKTAFIAVRMSRKVDENTAEDLAHEMREFRTLYPDVEYGPLSAKHPSYASFSKVFSIPKSRYEYVTFLNPGPSVPYLFSVVLNTGKRKASKQELQVYRDVVRSLEFIPQEGVKPLTRPGATAEGQR